MQPSGRQAGPTRHGRCRTGRKHVVHRCAVYRVDPFFPKTLPNNWIVGQVAGLAVDAQDHVWIIQRPSSVSPEEGAAALKPPAAMCCVPAPPVIEFDGDGNVVQAWGGPGTGYEWFQVEHGIYVDPAGNVWVGGNGDNDNHVLKFTREGKFLLQIGKSGQRGGSNDKATLGGPAAVEVDSAANEVYVADGYKNKRVVVFDATTGAYKRHWGAYGNVPVDGPVIPAAEQTLSKEPYDPAAPPSKQFRGPVHAVALSRRTRLRHRSDGQSHPAIQEVRRFRERTPGASRDTLAGDGLGRRSVTRSEPAVARVVGWIQSRRLADRSQDDEDRRSLRYGWPQCGPVRLGAQPRHRLEGKRLTAEVETGKRVQKFSRVGG